MEDPSSLLGLTAQIVTAQLHAMPSRSSEIPDLIASVYGALASVGAPALATDMPAIDKPARAVTVRKSLANPKCIISMIDGKPYKMLRRHLSTMGYNADTYRETFDLPADYPMVAPEYRETRRNIALAAGLGRKSTQVATDRAH